MLRRLADLARDRSDFAFESTLSGLSTARLIVQLMDLGYDSYIFYLWLPSPDFAVARGTGAGDLHVAEQPKWDESQKQIERVAG